MSKSVKGVLALVAVLLVITLASWGIYNVSSNSKAVGTIEVIEKQGEVNEEESNRALDSQHTSSSILTESNSSFNERLLKYESSIGYSESVESEGLQDTKYDQREPKEIGQPTGEAGEASAVLQGLGILQEDATRLLCSEWITVLSVDGLTIVSKECLQ